MHECPECGQACDCDGDDIWNDDLATYLNCTHECEEPEEWYGDDEPYPNEEGPFNWAIDDGSQEP